MSLAIAHRETVRSALRRVTRRRLNGVLELLEHAQRPAAGAGIHEARKQLKQLRALLRLMDPEIGHKARLRADKRLRAVAHTLSPLRDTAVLLKTLEDLCSGGALSSGSLAAVHSALHIQLKQLHARILRNRSQKRVMIDALQKVRRQMARWPLRHRGWKAIGAGLQQLYRAGHRAAAELALDASDDAIHRTRKRAKDLLYALEFLQPIQSHLMRSTIDAARRLTECLGDDHDLAVLECALSGQLHHRLAPMELKRLKAAIARRRRSNQRLAPSLARLLYQQSERAFIGNIHRNWHLWRHPLKTSRAQ